MPRERHRATSGKAKNKSARKRALMDETSFQPHGALLLPPYFPPLSSTCLYYVINLVRWFTLNNTDHVDLSISSPFLSTFNYWTFEVFMRVCTVTIYTTKQETKEKRTKQKENTRNERLILFDCKTDIAQTVIEPCRECNGKPPDNGTRRESREEPRSALPIENTWNGRIICTSVNIDTLISTVIYYSERDVRDNILHAATSYFMQKVVKRKRPRIVFDDSSAGCVLWEVLHSRVRIFRASQIFFLNGIAASYGTLNENPFVMRMWSRWNETHFLCYTVEFCIKNSCRNFQFVFVYFSR